jgi:hypothetical protein
MSDTEAPDTERDSAPFAESLLLIADELDKARDLAINGQAEIIAAMGALKESVHTDCADLADQMQRGFAMLAQLIEHNKEDTDAQIATIRSARNHSNGHAPAE